MPFLNLPPTALILLCAEYRLALDAASLTTTWNFYDTRIASVVLELGELELFSDEDTFEATKLCLRDEVTIFRLASVFDRLCNLKKNAINLRNVDELALAWWMQLIGADVDNIDEFWSEEVTMLWFGITLRALSMSQRTLKMLEVGQGDYGDEIPLPLSVFQWRGQLHLPNSSPVKADKLSLHINCDMHDDYCPTQKDSRDKLQQNIETFFNERFAFYHLHLTIADTYSEDGRSARWRLTTVAFSLTGLRSLTLDAEVLDVLPEEILGFCRKNKETLEKLSLRWLVLYPQDMEGMIKLLRAMRFRMPILTSVAINIAWRKEDGTEDTEQEFVVVMEDGRDGLEIMDNEIAYLEECLEALEVSAN